MWHGSENVLVTLGCDVIKGSSGDRRFVAVVIVIDIDVHKRVVDCQWREELSRHVPGTRMKTGGQRVGKGAVAVWRGILRHLMHHLRIGIGRNDMWRQIS